MIIGTTDEGCELQIFYDVDLIDDEDLEFTGSLVLCQAENNQLGLAGNYDSYQWSTGATTPEISINGPGNYSVTVTTTEFCIASSEVEIVEASDIQPVIEFINPNCVEANSGIIIVNPIEGGNPPYLYALGDGPFSEDNIFTNLPPGEYQVNILDAGGCDFSFNGTLEEVENRFKLVNEPQKRIFAGDTIALTFGTGATIISYQWTPTNGLSCADCETPIASPKQTTTYTLVATDNQGCTATTEFVVVVKESLIFMPNAFSPNQDGINDVIWPQTTGAVTRISRFAIYDRWGEAVFVVADAAPESDALRWRGDYKGQPLDNAIFTWFAEIELENGSKRLVSGDLALIK